MSASVLTSPDGCECRRLYKAALSDLHTDRLPQRIAEAEKALVIRARELFRRPGDNIEEEQAVDDAMYALHALRSTLKSSPKQRTREVERLKIA